MQGSPTAYFEAISKGISCFDQARKGGKYSRTYGNLGRKVRKQIKTWIDGGNPNISHYDSLMDAEKAAWQGRAFAAKQKYEIAILLPARGGMLVSFGGALEACRWFCFFRL